MKVLLLGSTTLHCLQFEFEEDRKEFKISL